MAEQVIKEMNKEDKKELDQEENASDSMNQVTLGILEVPVEASDDKSVIVSDHEAYPAIQMLCIDFVFEDQWWMPAQERLMHFS